MCSIKSRFYVVLLPELEKLCDWQSKGYSPKLHVPWAIGLWQSVLLFREQLICDRVCVCSVNNWFVTECAFVPWTIDLWQSVRLFREQLICDRVCVCSVNNWFVTVRLFHEQLICDRVCVCSVNNWFVTECEFVPWTIGLWQCAFVP
jgi:hypothetical protein